MEATTVESSRMHAPYWRVVVERCAACQEFAIAPPSFRPGDVFFCDDCQQWQEPDPFADVYTDLGGGD